MSSSANNVRRPLHETVVDSLGGRIARCEIAVGSRMKVEDLASEYGVSRTVMREALRELQSLGMIDSKRSVGSTVQPIGDWSLFHPSVIGWRIDAENVSAQLNALTELRQAIEPTAAAFAAQRRSNAQATSIVELAKKLEEAGLDDDIAAFVNHDVAFHRTILAASDNELFSSLADSITAALRGRERHGLLPTPQVRSFELHRHVAEAIFRRDSATAEAAMRESLDDVVVELGQLSPRVYGTSPARRR